MTAIDYRKPVDVVYVLGKGSIWHNNELRYSLRSVEKHLKGYGKIWIVGECPTWVCGVNWIPMQDIGHNHEMRIMNKIAQACMCEDISEVFLFMNDDHFFLKEANAKFYPYYNKGVLQHCIAERSPLSEYTRSMVNTQNALAKRHHDLGTFGIIDNFDIHTPIRYQKTVFKQVMNLFDWSVKDGYIIKTLYCNVLGIHGECEEDNKICQHLSREDFLARLENRHIFSIADIALNDASMQIFNELYPNKSQWEN